MGFELACTCTWKISKIMSGAVFSGARRCKNNAVGGFRKAFQECTRIFFIHISSAWVKRCWQNLVSILGIHWKQLQFKPLELASLQ